MHQSNSRNQFRVDWRTLGTALGALLLLYYLVPLLSLLGQSPGVIIGQLSSTPVIRSILTSLGSALTSTVLATAFGVPLAYWLARTNSRRKSFVTALVALPLVLPPIVSGMVLLSVFGPNTPIGAFADSHGIQLTRSFIGVVLAQTFVASPFVVVTSKAAFEGVDRQLEYASRTLGKDTWVTFRNVSLPLAKPGILAGVTLAFARAIGEFGATMMMAYHPRTMPVQVWVSFISDGIDAAFPVAVILLFVSFGVICVITVLGRNPWG